MSDSWPFPTLTPICQILDRWADGWVFDDSILLDPDRHVLSLEVHYLLYPARSNGWREVLPIAVDRLIFDNIDTFEKRIPEGEGTLWLSTASIICGESITFNFLQGSIRILSAQESVLVSTIISEENVTLFTLFGCELQLPHCKCKRYRQ